MVSNIVAAEAGAQAHADPQWVVFFCQGLQFGIRLDLVREILSPRPVTRLPGAGPEVSGLIGVRGRVVTVLDLGLMLGGRAAASLPDHRLLLLELGARRLAAAVDGVLTIAPAALTPPERPDRGTPAGGRDETAGIVADAVLGTAEVETGRFVALDPVALTAPLLG